MERGHAGGGRGGFAAILGTHETVDEVGRTYDKRPDVGDLDAYGTSFRVALAMPRYPTVG